MCLVTQVVNAHTHTHTHRTLCMPSLVLGAGIEGVTYWEWSLRGRGSRVSHLRGITLRIVWLIARGWVHGISCAIVRTTCVVAHCRRVVWMHRGWGIRVRGWVGKRRDHSSTHPRWGGVWGRAGEVTWCGERPLSSVTLRLH